MTGAKWKTCRNPQMMLGERCLQAKDRKRRLFAVACGRRVAHLVPDQKCQEAFELIERFADGHLDDAGLAAAIADVTAAVRAGRIRECDTFRPRAFFPVASWAHRSDTGVSAGPVSCFVRPVA